MLKSIYACSLDHSTLFRVVGGALIFGDSKDLFIDLIHTMLQIIFRQVIYPAQTLFKFSYGVFF